MKILLLSIENAMRLSAVEVEPKESGLIIIAGENGQGKSSVLNGIEGLIGGADALPPKPVRRGEQKAVIRAELGEFKPVRRTDLVVKRTITAAGGTSLVIKNADNQSQESPQSVLDKLYSNLTFDPLAFKTMKPDKRSETLCQLLGLDFKKEESEIALKFNTRTVINREVKQLEARVQAVKEYFDAPAEEQSAAAILEEQRKASETNRNHAAQRRTIEHLASNVELHRESAASSAAVVDRLKAQLDEANRVLLNANRLLAEKQSELEEAKKIEIPADIDLAPFSARVTEVEQTNSKVRANQEKKKLRGQLAEKVKESEALTKAIEAMESAKRKRRDEAKFPVEGLSIGDASEVLFNSLPFEQASTADQLKVSVMMGISMNPGLRVLLVRQGNDLDMKNLRLLDELAVANDVQIWLERVSTEGDVSVIIEDGRVKGVPTPSPSIEQPKTDTPTQKELV